MVGLERWWVDTPLGIVTLSVNRRATEGGFREPVHPLSPSPIPRKQGGSTLLHHTGHCKARAVNTQVGKDREPAGA